MKHYLLAALLLASVPVLAQEYQPKYPPPSEPYVVPPKAGAEGPQPFKKANVILAYTTDSAKVALKRTALLLQQQGYAIDRLDYDLLSITTKSKPFSNSIYNMSLLVVWDAGRLKFTGQWRGQVMGMTVEERIAYTNPASKKAFAEMQTAATAYPGARLVYLQQP